MRKRQLSIWIAACLLLAAPASAITVSAGDVVSAGGQGQTSVVIGNLTISTNLGTLNVTNANGLVSLGASAGFEADEFDVIGETLTLSFSGDAVNITEIVVGRLFRPDVQDDAVFETLTITTDDNGGVCTGGCTASADGSWDGEGSLGAIPGHGTWALVNPFGEETGLNQIMLAPDLLNGFPGGSFNSDFSFVSISFVPAELPVPEPATAALLGLGLVGLAAHARRRR